MRHLIAITIIALSLLCINTGILGQGNDNMETEQISFGEYVKDTLGEVILFMPNFTFTTIINQLPKQQQPYIQAFSLFIDQFHKKKVRNTNTFLQQELEVYKSTLATTDSLILLDYGLWIRENDHLYLRFELLSEGKVTSEVVSINKGLDGYSVSFDKNDKFSNYLSLISSPAHFKLMNSNFKPVALFQAISSKCKRKYFSYKPNLECLLSIISDLDQDTIQQVSVFSKEARSKLVFEKFAL